jgi:hypothetical protein
MLAAAAPDQQIHRQAVLVIQLHLVGQQRELVEVGEQIQTQLEMEHQEQQIVEVPAEVPQLAMVLIKELVVAAARV